MKKHCLYWSSCELRTESGAEKKYPNDLTLLPADSVCEKWSQAKNGVSKTKLAFKQLTECLDAGLVQEWTEQEHVAMEQCGDHPKIYEVALKKCKKCFDLLQLWITHFYQYQH